MYVRLKLCKLSFGWNSAAPRDVATFQRWRSVNRADFTEQADEGWHGATRHGRAAGPQGNTRLLYCDRFLTCDYDLQ